MTVHVEVDLTLRQAEAILEAQLSAVGYGGRPLVLVEAEQRLMRAVREALTAPRRHEPGS